MARARPSRDRRPIHLSFRPRLTALEERLAPAAADLDPTFGNRGVVTAAIPGSNAVKHEVNDSAVMPDGSIVYCGTYLGSPFVAKLLPDGTPDPAFGSGGLLLNLFGVQGRAQSVAVWQPGPNRAPMIVVVGTRLGSGLLNSPELVADFEVVRLDAEGHPDPSFGQGGAVVQSTSAQGSTDQDVFGDLAVRPDGRVVVAGSGRPNAIVGGGDRSLVVFELGADGRLDASSVLPAPASPDQELAQAVGLQGDGSVVVAGRVEVPATGRSFVDLVRFPADGSPVERTQAGLGGSIIPGDLAVLPDDRVLVSGTVAGRNSVSAAVLGFTAGDQLDPQFAGGQAPMFDIGLNTVTTPRLAVQPDGRFLLCTNTATFEVAVLRFTPDGRPDGSFTRDGTGIADYGLSFGSLGIHVLPDKKILLTGNTVVSGLDSVAAARLIGDSGSVSAASPLPPGTVPPPAVAVGGAADGSARVFTADPATGRFGPSPVASPQPFGAIPAAVRVAVGDVDGNGTPDTVFVTGPGTPIRVAVVSGVDNGTVLVAPFDPFGGNFTGGGFVTAADLDHDGRAEFIVTPDRGGGPRVAIFSLNPDGSVATRANFFGIDDPNFRGGCRAALGDVNKDGTPDLAVAAGFGGGPRVALFDGKTVLGGTPARLVGDFFAFPGADAVTLRNGVFVAAGDVTGDGSADLIFGGGPGGAPRVFILSGALIAAGNIQEAYDGPVANFFVAGNGTDRGGVRVAVEDADGDNRADVVAGSGEGSPANVRVYLGKNFTGPGEPAVFQDIAVFGGAVLTDGVFVG